MKTVFPVTLNNGDGMVIKVDEVPFIISNETGFMGYTGTNGDGSSLTNIVGFDGEELLKKCTNCGQIKPSASGFGPKGRCTDPKGIRRRDQAQCIECRGRKK